MKAREAMTGTSASMMETKKELSWSEEETREKGSRVFLPTSPRPPAWDRDAQQQQGPISSSRASWLWVRVFEPQTLMGHGKRVNSWMTGRLARN
ncbi:unnamed protein product [Linum trigynum]|uniref:Uncharacterized protein n=1 Tax=Linum trigynum TaxID=586398 RepID=A0AAV2CKJ4_9ROSI